VIFSSHVFLRFNVFKNLSQDLRNYRVVVHQRLIIRTLISGEPINPDDSSPGDESYGDFQLH